jgi:peptide/nickel transport system ATP-binding protein
MLLKVTNLQIIANSDPQNPICSNLNFYINKGETLGILGESGSGKSITALSILKLLSPGLEINRGEILFTGGENNDINLLSLSEKQLQNIRGKDISMVFQEPMSSLNPVISCGQQVVEVIQQHLNYKSNHAKEYTLELFRKVKFPDPERVFSSFPHQLSGGQKQRVMIAMAIACKPQLLIADEPTTALDVTVQKSILDLLRELQQEMGMSILFITHDISVLAEISHRALVFNKGQIVEEGDISAILHQAKHPYTIGLMNCRFSIEHKGLRLKTLNDLNSTDVNSIKSDLDQVIDLNTPVFETHNLEVAFRQPQKTLFSKTKYTTILHKIDLSVYKNETLGLVGESGSGKTTLGRSLLQLIQEQSGEILFHGNPLHKFSHHDFTVFRRKVQIIFQDPYSSLNPKITIGEAIGEPLYTHNLCNSNKQRKQRVLELLRQVNLKEEHYSRYPHQFSGGQRQRIGIARALAVKPELIILDESVAALDVSIQAQILNLLNDLKLAYNLTYIFISHDLNVVRYMSDRIIVLKDGQIVETGNSESVFKHPQSDYTKKLLASIPGRNAD